MKGRRVVALARVATVLLFASLAWAQGGNPPASTKESGETSGHGMTAVEQTAQAEGGVEQQIKTIYLEGTGAALKGDTGYQEKYLADDWVGISGATGQTLTKNEAIQRRKSGAVKYESVNERDVKVRVYGDTAIVNTVATVKATSDGKPINGDFRASAVYVKQNGQWKQVLFQSTPMTAEKK